MKYFVTGATGFIGGRVARQLVEAGHQVVAIARNPAKAQDLTALGIDVQKGDVTDKESMRTAMRSVDGVFHIAGWYKIGTKDKSEGVKINIDGTRNVLELMQELKIAKGVYTSTLAVNSNTGGRLVDETYRFTGTYLSEYERTKAAAHDIAAAKIKEGLPLVIAQPGLVYGPGDASAAHDALVNFLKRQLPLMPKKTAYCWAHVDDTARAHLLAMEKGQVGANYFICGPAWTFVEALKLAERITGVPAPHMVAAPGMLKALSALMGMVEKVASLPEAYTAEYLRVSAGVTYIGDNAKAKRELGFNPRPLEEGLRETLFHEMKRLGMTAPQQ